MNGAWLAERVEGVQMTTALEPAQLLLVLERDRRGTHVASWNCSVCARPRSRPGLL